MAPRLTLLGVPTNSAGTLDGVARAPARLRAAGLVAALADAGLVVEDLGDVSLPAPTTTRDEVSGLIAPDALGGMVTAVARRVETVVAAASFPLLIGGDCPLLLGCLEGARRAVGPVGLVFVDGHEDAWPPARSPTGEAADCELGLALGYHLDGLPEELATLLPLVEPNEVTLLGARDAVELAAAGVASLAPVLAFCDPPCLRARGPGAVGREAVGRCTAAAKRVWLHVDLDVLATHALAAVDYQQPGGLEWHELIELTQAVLADPATVGCDVTIFNPDLDDDGRGAESIVSYLGHVATALATR